MCYMWRQKEARQPAPKSHRNGVTPQETLNPGVSIFLGFLLGLCGASAFRSSQSLGQRSATRRQGWAPLLLEAPAPTTVSPKGNSGCFLQFTFVFLVCSPWACLCKKTSLPASCVSVISSHCHSILQPPRAIVFLSNHTLVPGNSQ